MDLEGNRKPFWIRPDAEEDREPSSSSLKRLKNSSSFQYPFSNGGNTPLSRLMVSGDGMTNKQLLMRQASHLELSMSSPRGAPTSGSPLKHLQAKASPMTFDRLTKATPAKLHKFHTEPLLRALCEELRKETGVAPEIPEKSHNPFEPENLADFLQKTSTSASMFADRPASPEGFRWSIHHMSQLHPVEIDNKVDLMRTELLKHVHTEEDEENAQAGIRRFFDEVYDLPSPASNEQLPTLFPDLETSPSSSEASYDAIKRVGRNFRPVETACQTDVHMSPNFDFDRFFADFKIRAPDNSVRRRLFTDQDDFEMNAENPLEESLGFGSQNRSSGVWSKFEIDAELSPVEDDDDEELS